MTGKCAAALGVTISAWLGSLLFTVGYFHLFSPSALFANLLAVPLAFAVLVLGIATLLTAPLWKLGAVLCNNANWFCAKALLAILKVCALVPGGWFYVETPRLSPQPDCEITVLDLSDGGAAHLRTGGRDWLLDCGNKVAYEHIMWDQANVLVQIGLIDPTGLPVTGSGAAAKLRNPALKDPFFDEG